MPENENKTEINEVIQADIEADGKPLTAVVFEEKQMLPIAPYWKIWEVFLCFAAIFVISNCCSIFLYAAGMNESLSNLFATIVQTLLTILLPLWVVRYIYGYDKSYLGFNSAKNKLSYFKAFLLGIAYYFVATVILLVIIAVYPFEIETQSAILPLLNADNIFVLIALFIISGFLAPLSEEIFFRGFLYAAIRRRISVMPAAIISGVLFGAVHFDLLRFIPIAFLGFLLSLIYEKYKNIFINIFVHMGFNITSLFLLLFI